MLQRKGVGVEVCRSCALIWWIIIKYPFSSLSRSTQKILIYWTPSRHTHTHSQSFQPFSQGHFQFQLQRVNPLHSNTLQHFNFRVKRHLTAEIPPLPFNCQNFSNIFDWDVTITPVSKFFLSLYKGRYFCMQSFCTLLYFTLQKIIFFEYYDIIYFSLLCFINFPPQFTSSSENNIEFRK